jgi:CheY-like chemotaxis protein
MDDKRSRAEPMRVLVVDDNRDNADSLALLLSAMGHRAAATHDGLSAEQEAQVMRFDLVLLDVAMPGMDGYELARRLRHQPGTAAALLVCFSGYADAAHRRLAREAGCDHFLAKPVDLTDLQRMLRGAEAGTASAAQFPEPV